MVGSVLLNLTQPKLNKKILKQVEYESARRKRHINEIQG